MHPFLEDDIGSRFHFRLLALSSAVALCAACASPRRQPLDDSQIAASVANRASSVAELETALALAEMGPLGIPRPPSLAALDPSNPDFWHACAYLYEPSVRQARRRLEARRALAKGAGAVESIGAGVDHVRKSSDYETEAMATIDLLALLGLGPSAAAKELARAEVCEALGDLEAAVWAARFRVARALVRLEAAEERERIAAGVDQDAAKDETRITTLQEAGRGAPSEISWARASLEWVREARARAAIQAAQAREELAVASGLPPEHEALGHLFDSRISGLRENTLSSSIPLASTDPQFLLCRLPSLRILKLRYAVAEARVRSAAAASWPGVELGPKITAIPDTFLTGGILDLRLPLPAATQPVICSAIIERTAAREALEDELIEALARNQSLNSQTRLAGDVEHRAYARRAAAETMWNASRARFLSDETALMGWILGLEMRLESAMAAIEASESESLLVLSILEASPSDLSAVPETFIESRPETRHD